MQDGIYKSRKTAEVAMENQLVYGRVHYLCTYCRNDWHLAHLWSKVAKFSLAFSDMVVVRVRCDWRVTSLVVASQLQGALDIKNIFDVLYFNSKPRYYLSLDKGSSCTSQIFGDRS